MPASASNRDRPSRSGRLPPDLAAVVAATLLVVVAAFAPVISETPLRVPVGIAFVLFVPGYAVVAALFPERNRASVADVADGDGGDESAGSASAEPRRRTRWLGAGTGLDGVDRLSLSVVVSVVVVAAVGVAVHYTPWPIRAGPVVAVVAAITLLATAVAARRRRALAPSVAFAVPTQRWRATVKRAVRSPDSRGDALLTGLLIVAVVLMLASVGVAVGPGFGADADDTDGYSALYLEHDGALLTNESAVLEDTENASGLTVGIENEEHRTVEYTVVAVAQELEADGDAVTVENRTELDRREAELAHGETRELEYELESVSDDDSRIVWLLYPDDVPDEPSTTNAEAYVTLSLSEASDDSGGSDGSND